MSCSRIHRLTLLCTIAALLVSSLATAAVNAAEEVKKPNILFILVDDMGWSDIGCYGGEVKTPHLNKLANEGMRFTGMHNTSKCFPSRACLVTGTYAQNCGMASGPGQIKNAVTLGDVLRTAGYTTLWAGKHHGTQNPYEVGFDHYAGLRDGACNHFNPGAQREGEARPAQKRKNRTWCFDEKTVQPFTPEDKKFYTTDSFTNWALEWLDEQKTSDKPFFLYMAYTAPHDPLMAWPEDIAKYEGVYDKGYDAIRQARYKRQVELGLFDPKTAPLTPASHAKWESLDEKKRADEIRRMQVYAAMIDRVDQNIGRLLKKIEDLGELDNTLVFFASDNGASSEVVNKGEGQIGNIDRWSSQKGDWANVSNTPFRMFKNYTFEGGINTPLIAWWPGRVPAGKIVSHPAHFIDIMPTLVELTGAKYPTRFRDQPIVPMQGESILPVLKGEEVTREKPIFWQWSNGRAVRQGKWKLVCWARRPKAGEPDTTKWELYDIDADRTEVNDLAATHPEVVRKMTAMWIKWRATCDKLVE